jgi:putative glutamine amidotransferase
MRPLIGITCYVEPVTWGPWRDVPSALLPQAYVQAVTAAGGRPVLLPPDDIDAGVLDALDALVLAGGADIDPARYGAPIHPATNGLRTDRDAGELLLLTAALARDMPLLGICRGLQLMAVAAGGVLAQHMPDVVGSEVHRPTPGVYGAHGARFAAGSLIAEILGESATVNSYHHQGIADPGTLTVTGWADDDTIEVLEDPTRRFALGVQWHPEVTDDRRLFLALTRAALAATTRP